MADDRSLRRVRPYHWGAIYLHADGDADFDIDFHGPGPVFATEAHAAVRVVHAGMVDEAEADVVLDVRVADRRAGGLPHEVALTVPKGVLVVGDADHQDEIVLAPGRWLVQAGVDDPAEARHVTLVVSPLAETAEPGPE